jgi:hypothetical protein
MFNWFKKLKEIGEVWYYECENGHKWHSRQSPKGNAFLGLNLLGEPCTRCSICGSEVIIGNMYINGKLTGMGSVHVDFKRK